MHGGVPGGRCPDSRPSLSPTVSGFATPPPVPARVAANTGTGPPAEDEQCNAVGFSAGGVVARAAAVEEPISGLVTAKMPALMSRKRLLSGTTLPRAESPMTAIPAVVAPQALARSGFKGKALAPPWIPSVVVTAAGHGGPAEGFANSGGISVPAAEVPTVPAAPSTALSHGFGNLAEQCSGFGGEFVRLFVAMAFLSLLGSCVRDAKACALPDDSVRLKRRLYGLAP